MVTAKQDAVEAIQRSAPPPENHSTLDVTASDKSDDDCLKLFADLPMPQRDDDLVAAIEKLAETNPLRAIELARSEHNLHLRERLLGAAFHGWGKTDAEAAADWILSQSEHDFDHDTAIASVFKGAVENPDSAVQFCQQLIQKFPDRARDYGDDLIYALAQKGNFTDAARFALNGGDLQLRTELLAAAYGSWANYQPQSAAASAAQISDADARADALDAVITSWGPTDPQGLADFAETNLPSGGQKTRALSQALVFWAGESPADTANWINNSAPSPEFDSGKAAIATQQQAMQQPSIALQWAESIIDPDLRSRTVAAVVETWLLSDRSAALNFARTTDDLLPDDRANVIGQLNF